MVVCEVFQILPNGPSNYDPHSIVVLQTCFDFSIFVSLVAAGQVNTLQCCCFLSLAMAAFSFHCRAAWFSRLALVLPFLLSAALCTLTPDSAESLAMRLWKDQ